MSGLHVMVTDENDGKNCKKDQQQHVYWLEGRPQEAGRNVLVRYDPTAAKTSSRNAVDVTPATSNVRTRVHEYGGAAVVMGRCESSVWFSEFATQQVCRLTPATCSDGNHDVPAAARPVTPAVAKAQYRYADGVLTADEQTMICIREDHTKATSSKDVVNQVVAIDLRSDVDDADTNHHNVRVLATGKDFYAAPRLSPDGKSLCYVCWDHPNMPWDATELRITSFTATSASDDDESSSSSSLTEQHKLVAGSDGDTSIIQPLWHPQTGDLYYISDQSGYYNIYRRRRGDAAETTAAASSVLPMPYDFGGPAPGWVLGQQGFCFLPHDDGRLVAHFTKDGKSVLLVAKVPQGDDDTTATDVQEYGMDDGLPMQFGGIVCGSDSDLYFMGGSPSTPPSVYQWNLQTKGPAKILACSSSLQFPDHVISVPKSIEFPTTLGTAFGYYYPPKNGGFTCTTEDAPPLLVKAHGGPTACTGTSFNPGIQFWTSRGFAVLDVDYGGSTGYGRDYRRRLRKSWGIVDVDDVCAGAEYLVQQGLADGNRLCIDGGSAGGYTTLGALAFRDVFKAGCSLYGIGDLTALAGDTHKFESRYLDGLVGPYPQDEEDYKKRSPIESVDTLSCPILLLQGDEDKVVPPNQAEMMHEALLKKGIPTCLKIYKGEQHGFRKAENIEDALRSELAFYGKVFGIDVPGATALTIDNMKD